MFVMLVIVLLSSSIVAEEADVSKKLSDAEHTEHKIEKKNRQSSRHAASNVIHSGSDAQKQTKRAVSHALRGKEDNENGDEDKKNDEK